jgi:hypothetical protein
LDPNIISLRDAEVTVSVMWAIWTSRNKYMHGEIVFRPRKSIELVDEFIRALKGGTGALAAATMGASGISLGENKC